MIVKLLATADWHVHNWNNYSKVDENNIPDRLYKYLELAKDFNALSTKLGVNFRILAGDFTQSAVVKPSVLNVERDVLKLLDTSGIPTYMIYGNHDLDTKSSKCEASLHSLLLGSTDKLSNIHYFDHNSVIEYQGVKLGFRPWSKDDLTFDSNEYSEWSTKDLDIFVGHDIVSEATNNEGYPFFGGYSKELLFSIAPISIIGDIHRHHHYTDNSGKTIIIPGCPIQSTFKDDANCGFTYLEYDTDTHQVVKYQFISIHELHPDFYHKFIYVNDESEIVQDTLGLTHYRVRNRIKVEDKTVIMDCEDVSYDLSTLINNVALVNKPKEVQTELLNTTIQESLNAISTKDVSAIKNSTIDKVVINNFSSISHLELDFNNLNRDIVIVGKTGSGKTSVVEAIYWAITNKTTKGVSVNSIRNWYASPEDITEVSVYLTIEDDKYIVKRTRLISGGGCEILKLVNGEYVSFEGFSTRDTNVDILQLLNLKEWEIFLLSYFSAEGMLLYNDLGKSTKTELLNKIVSSSEVESLRVYCSEKLAEVSGELSNLRSSYEESVRTYNANCESLKTAQDIMKSQSELIQRQKNLTQKKQMLSESYMLAEKSLQENSSKSMALLEEKYKLESQLNSINSDIVAVDQIDSDIQRFTEQINHLNSASCEHRCPVCNQIINDESKASVIKNYTDNISTLTERKSGILTKLNTTSISELKKSIIMKMDTLQSQIQLLSSDRESHNRTKQEYLKVTSELDAIKINDKSELIEYLNKTILEISKRLEELKTKGQQLSAQEATLTYLAKKVFKRDGLLSRELNKLGLKIIQKELDYLVQDHPMSCRMDDNFNLQIRYQGREETCYAEMSSGQKRFADAISAIALQNVFSKLYHLPNGILGLAVYDEMFSHTDDKYNEILKDLLDKSMSKHYVVISHDDRFSSMFSTTITVSLDGKGQSSMYSIT